jgi:hypothetical protein
MLAEFIPWNRFLGSINVKKYELSILIHTGKGGRFEPERRGEGQHSTVHKARSKIPVCKLPPAAKSLYKSIFLDDDMLLWCLYSLFVHGHVSGVKRNVGTDVIRICSKFKSPPNSRPPSNFVLALYTCYDILYLNI